LARSSTISGDYLKVHFGLQHHISLFFLPNILESIKEIVCASLQGKNTGVNCVKLWLCRLRACATMAFTALFLSWQLPQAVDSL
jgi:hypothetical protein